MIDLHPGVDLDKVSNELRTCHQLAEPWFAEFLWCGKESFCFGTVQKRQYRRIRIVQNFPHAPAGDRSVSQYEREGVKVIDYTSHDKDTAYYDMVLKKEGETLLIKFEPDDKYLEAVEFKYRQKVIRRSTQA